jgi:nucleotide-binding universal stress UspA family protein
MVKFQFLLPIDESVYSDTAADNAIKMAKMYNADVSLVYVVDTGVFEDKEEIESQTKFGKSLLGRFQQYFNEKGLNIEKSSVLVGSPFNEIIKMQKEIDASLIILGASDNNLGSVAERVVRGAKCHILIARRMTAGDDPFRHILVPVDGSKDSEYATQFASSFAHRTSSNLIIFHVIHNEKKMQKGTEITNKALDTVKSRDITVESQIGEGKISQEILNEIDNESIDLTVIGYTGKGRISRMILGSVSEKTIRSTKCSVFVVKSVRTEKVYTIQK